MTIEELRNTKRAEILRLAARRGAGNLRVFGSVARGESDACSDIDFLVDLEPGRRRRTGQVGNLPDGMDTDY
jgi:predicted nucleotidyltransferase